MRLILILISILGIYLMVFMGMLERPEDHPRFHIQTPIPAEADTAKCAPGKYGGRVLIGFIGNPSAFNPIILADVYSGAICSLIFPTLIFRDNITQELIPWLASGWEFSQDNLSITYHLRRGVLWSDGVPVTAYDIKFSYDTIYDPKVPNMLNDMIRVKGQPLTYAVIDSFAFKISSPSPCASLLLLSIFLPIIPRHVLEPELKAGKFFSAYGLNTPPEKIVGCGPYLLEKFEPGVKTVLRRNPYYWRVDCNGNRLPYIDRIIFVGFSSYETMLLSFQTGSLNMIESINQPDVPIIQREAEKGKYRVINLGPTLTQRMFHFNLNPGKTPQGTPFVEPYKLKWFQDIRWRKAMSYAVDRESIINSVFDGLAQPQYGPETTANKCWYNPNCVKYPFDLKQAAAYLEEMGLTDRNGDGIREDTDGHIVEFTMFTNSSNHISEFMGNIIKDDLATIGIKMNLSLMEFKTLITKTTVEHTYESYLGGILLDLDPYIGSVIWLSSSIFHEWNPSQKKPDTSWEAEIDRLMNLQMTTFDRNKRKEYYNRIQYIISDQLPYIYLVAPNDYVGLSNKFQNLTPAVIYHPLLWKIDEAWIKE